MDDLPGPGFRQILRKAAALSGLYGWVRDCCAGKTVLCLLAHLRMTRKAQEAFDDRRLDRRDTAAAQTENLFLRKGLTVFQNWKMVIFGSE